MRDEWPEPALRMWGDLDPAMNAVGLFWCVAIDGEGPPKWENRNG